MSASPFSAIVAYKKSLNEETKNLTKLTQCPSCGKSSNNLRFYTLSSCGHHYCNICCDKFVKPVGKCPTCLVRFDLNQIIEDTFMTTLMKMGNQLEKNESERKNQKKKLTDKNENVIESVKKIDNKPKMDYKLFMSSQRKKMLGNRMIKFDDKTETRSPRSPRKIKAQMLIKLDDDAKNDKKDDTKDDDQTQTSKAFTSEDNSTQNELKDKINDIIDGTESDDTIVIKTQKDVSVNRNKVQKNNHKKLEIADDQISYVQDSYDNNSPTVSQIPVVSREKELVEDLKIKRLQDFEDQDSLDAFLQKLKNTKDQALFKESAIQTETKIKTTLDVGVQYSQIDKREIGVQTDEEINVDLHNKHCCLTKMIQTKTCPSLNAHFINNPSTITGETISSNVNDIINDNDLKPETIEQEVDKQETVKEKDEEINESGTTVQLGPMTQLETFMKGHDSQCLAENENKTKTDNQSQKNLMNTVKKTSNKRKVSVQLKQSTRKRLKNDKNDEESVSSDSEVNKQNKEQKTASSKNSAENLNSKVRQKRNSTKVKEEMKVSIGDDSDVETKNDDQKHEQRKSFEVSLKRSTRKKSKKEKESEECSDTELVKQDKFVDSKKNIENVNSTKPKPKPKPKSKILFHDDKNSDEDDKETEKVTSIISSPTCSSITSSVSNARLSRRQLNEKQNFCILTTSLSDKEYQQLKSLSNKLSFKVVDQWNDDVTHLIVSLVDNKKLIGRRTIKYLKAVLGNKWIISSQWISASTKSDKFVDEKNYEIVGVGQSKKQNVPCLSRTSQKKLFKNNIVYFKGELGKDMPSIEDCQELVRIGGGEVIESEIELEKFKKKAKLLQKKIIIVTDLVSLPDTQDSVKIIPILSFINSITNFDEL